MVEIDFKAHTAKTLSGKGTNREPTQPTTVAKIVHTATPELFY